MKTECMKRPGNPGWWWLCVALVWWCSPAVFAAQFQLVDGGAWPGSKSTLQIFRPSGLLKTRLSSVNNGVKTLGKHSFLGGNILVKSTGSLGNGNLVYTFTPAVPAREIAFALIDVGFAKGQVRITGGATTADFVRDQWPSPPYKAMLIQGSNWTAVNGTPFQSSGIWVGRGGKLVSRITITVGNDGTSDLWYAAIAHQQCASSSDCDAALPVCNNVSKSCSKPFARGGHYANWIFGDNCQVSWDASYKVTVGKPPAAFSTGEGCSTYSNPSTGNLILYTDGRTVWNASGKVLSTGNIGGNPSGLHSGLIIPSPGELGQYYVFANGSGRTPVKYAKFDMRVAPGKQVGGIKTLIGISNETQQVIPHTNGRDYWHIASSENKIYVTPITNSGVGAVKTVTISGTNTPFWWGPFRVSNDGKKIATSRSFGSNIRGGTFPLITLDFDPSKGTISNQQTILNLSTGFTYEAEFSPDNSKLYIVYAGAGLLPYSWLYQIDLKTKKSTLITRYPKSTIGSLRLAPDGKIYVASNGRAYLHAIEKPNVAGTGCGFKADALKLASGCSARLGLPTAPATFNALPPATCGNGKPDPGEQCDDNNTVNGDGCSSTCKIELDNDKDKVLDEVDLDSDNDGIPNKVELGGELAGDKNKNGVLDYKDPTLVTCTDTTPKDGVCDKLPVSVDADGDGIPNHLDLDSDNDGIPDIVEAGGVDNNGDGRVDSFVDANKDGLHDPYAAKPLPLFNSDKSGGPDYLDTDSDNDGVTDTTEAGGRDVNRDGRIDGFTDKDKNGLHDAVQGKALPLPDADGDRLPNYRDTCADGRKTGAEACDDGNGRSNDGCSSTCKREAGFTCKGGSTNGPSICTKDNVAPKITGTPSANATQGQKYSFAPGLVDPDSGQKHSWRSTKALPKGAVLNTSTGALTWTPTNDQAGKTYEFGIEVCDNGSPKKCDTKTWKVTVKNVNDRPQITNNPGTQVVFGSSYRYQPVVKDPDVGDKHTYKLISTASGAKVNPTTGEVSWTPKAGDVGKTFNFELEVCDNGTPRLCVKKTWKVTVTTTNKPPVITSKPPTEAVVYKKMTYPAKANDPNKGDGLTWSLKKGPAGASVDPKSGQLTWTPKPGDVGKDVEFQVEVCDNGKPPYCATQTFKVKVKELACGVDSDCPGERVCLEAKCAEPGCYLKASTCPTGELCVASKCTKDDCANKSCGKDEFCRPTDSKCVKSCLGVKCAYGERCEDGSCVADPCASKKCPAGQTCVAGTCTVERCKETNACRHGRLCKARENACGDDLCKGVKCPDAAAVCKDGQCVLKDECMLDDDCKDAELCVKGTCVAPACGSKNPCSEGKLCVDGVCVEDACKDKSCDKGQVCKAGTCVETCASIRCEAGEFCKEGKCVKDPCAEKSCAQGERCKNGACVRDRCRKDACKDGRRCDVDRCLDDPCGGINCPAGLTCKDGQCTGTRSCDVDGECPGDLVCLEGKCTEPGCFKKKCADGKVCQGGTCKENPCGGKECGEDEICRPSDGECVKLCPTCEEGQTCKDGECVDDPCAGKECKAGEVCVDGACQPEPCADATGDTCRHGRICKAKGDKKSCGADPCGGLSCPNGGTCKDGVCLGSKPAEESAPEVAQDTGDSGTANESDEPKEVYAAGGCSCATGRPSLPLSLLSFLLFVGLVSRRRKR